jgi:hypothetical protein
MEGRHVEGRPEAADDRKGGVERRRLVRVEERLYKRCHLARRDFGGEEPKRFRRLLLPLEEALSICALDDHHPQVVAIW